MTDVTTLANDRIRRVLGLLLLNDPAAADELDTLADELRAAADRLRASQTNPNSSPGGMSDRVQMTVIGPDGKPKSHHDTGARP